MPYAAIIDEKDGNVNLVFADLLMRQLDADASWSLRRYTMSLV